MADLDDMEMVECPHCGKKCPKDFFPICSCKQDLKAGKKPAKAGKSKKANKAEDPYDYDF